jgi:hypothetical protein
MSIPLDRLYNHIDRLSQSLCGDCLVIYRFSPHGSKKLNDLIALTHTLESKNWAQWQTSPSMMCHDQEPLQHELYNNDLIKNYTLEKYSGNENSRYLVDMISNMHLRAVTYYPLSCYDLTLLTHSEKNSEELIKYQNHGFVGVYWWSHAVIARDWFRYAENITQQKNVSNRFLIYNRAWAGTREYRLKFAEYLINNNLLSHCQMKLNPRDPELDIHYTQHQFKNIAWKPERQLEDYFDANSADSCCSADFELTDYESSDIEVVLETLFDDSRLHLTEKILRPIALAQPFILAGTPGSLNYLKSYGFKTFESIWNEDYDQIQDSKSRLVAITDLMKTISQWDSHTRRQKLQQAQEIADHNKKLFFSKAWQDSIIEEYQSNLQSAWEIMKQNRTGKYFVQLREFAKVDKEWARILDSDLPWRTQRDVQQVADWIKNPR